MTHPTAPTDFSNSFMIPFAVFAVAAAGKIVKYFSPLPNGIAHTWEKGACPGLNNKVILEKQGNQIVCKAFKQRKKTGHNPILLTKQIGYPAGGIDETIQALRTMQPTIQRSPQGSWTVTFH